MIRPGLVSITFRQLEPRAIVDLSVRAGLQGIEWGGDVHVPHGDLERAREVRTLTEDAGLHVAAYGSYYRAGHSEQEGLALKSVLDTAVALGAPCLRIWSGTVGSAEAGRAYRSQVRADARRVAERAADAGLTVVCEFHGGSLTDTPESTLDFLRKVDHPALHAYWQPDVHVGHGERLAGLRDLLPHLMNMHVFQWVLNGKIERLPLAEGREEWLDYLTAAASTKRDHWALIEFVSDDTPEQLLRDAETLKMWLRLIETPIS